MKNTSQISKVKFQIITKSRHLNLNRLLKKTFCTNSKNKYHNKFQKQNNYEDK